MPTPGGIIHPTALVLTITANELTGAINCTSNRPTPHLQAIAILSQVILAQVQDSLRTAAKGANDLLNPTNNPGNNPAGGKFGN